MKRALELVTLLLCASHNRPACSGRRALRKFLGTPIPNLGPRCYATLSVGRPNLYAQRQGTTLLPRDEAAFSGSPVKVTHVSGNTSDPTAANQISWRRKRLSWGQSTKGGASIAHGSAMAVQRWQDHARWLPCFHLALPGDEKSSSAVCSL